MTLLGGRTAVPGPAPATLYDQALAFTTRGASGALTMHYRDRAWQLPLRQWCAPADAVDLAALDRLCAGLPPSAEVLDVGCGPGRHTAALHGRGLLALGVDTSPAAVALAQRRGAPALRADAFGPLPGASHGWHAVLLLDGNVGIGGDPTVLLARVSELLRPGGLVLVELDPAGSTDRGAARLTRAGATSRDFAWARLGAAALAGVAGAAGLAPVGGWADGGRSFALLAPRVV